MKGNKHAAVTLITIGAALLLLIGWVFYRNLVLPGIQEGPAALAPPKAVMAQAQALNEARLEELARRGQAAIGMSMTQVRLALGEPVRSMMDSSNTVRTTWWYDHQGRRTIHFGADGKVSSIDQ